MLAKSFKDCIDSICLALPTQHTLGSIYGDKNWSDVNNWFPWLLLQLCKVNTGAEKKSVQRLQRTEC